MNIKSWALFSGGEACFQSLSLNWNQGLEIDSTDGIGEAEFAPWSQVPTLALRGMAL